MSQRFSDAELACEWWRVDADIIAIGEYNRTHEKTWEHVDDDDDERHQEIHAIIHRFATLPHAHEPNLVPEDTKAKP